MRFEKILGGKVTMSIKLHARWRKIADDKRCKGAWERKGNKGTT